MEAIVQKTGHASKLIRRFIAIILVGLAIVSLFWPSVIAVGGTMRKDLKAEIDSLEEYVEKNRYELENRYGSVDLFTARQTYRYLFEYLYRSGERAKAAGDLDTYETYSVAAGIIREFSEKLNRNITTDFFGTLYRSGKDLGLSFSEIRKLVGQLPYFADKASEMWPAEVKAYDGAIKGIKYGNIGYNVLFFLVIALAIAAIVLMFMNRSKFWVILFTIFAVLFAGIFIALWIFMLVKDFHMFIPGVSMFALPILAIAACIVYKRDKSYKGIFPKREKKERPVARVEAPIQPAYEPYVAPVAAPVFTPAPEPEPVFTPEPEPVFTPEPVKEAIEAQPEEPVFVPAEEPAPAEEPTPAEEPAAEEPAVEGWPCPNCGLINEADSKFCTGCGTRKPDAAPVCPNCGAPVREGVRFCTKCGTKLN